MRAALVAAPLCAIALPWLRWAAGGLEWGERSLLVRAGYLSSAWEAMLASPIWGWGPAGFQLADLSFRPSWSVEEVSSAHAAIADWCAALGVPAGLAVVAALIVIVWRVPMGTVAPRAQADHLEEAEDARGAARTATFAVCVAWLAGVGCELASLDPVALLVRLVALGAALWIARQAACAAVDPARSALGACACGASAALLAHGQIDMTFWLPSSAPIAWLALGCCAALGASQGSPSEPAVEQPAGMMHRRRPSMPWTVRATRAILASAGIALLVAGGSLARQDLVMVRAAQDVSTAGGDAESRVRAAQALLHAWTIEPGRSPVAVAAANQALAAVRALNADSSRECADRVRAVVHDAHEAAGVAAQMNATAFSAAQARARLAVAAAKLRWMGWATALDSCEIPVAIDPRSVGAWLTLAEAREGAGDRGGAADAIERALEADATYALDPVRQMGDARRSAWQSKANALRGG